MISIEHEQLVEDGLARVDEAATFLGIGRSKLYAELKSGRLAHCMIGRSRRIPWRALREFAAKLVSRGDKPTS